MKPETLIFLIITSTATCYPQTESASEETSVTTVADYGEESTITEEDATLTSQTDESVTTLESETQNFDSDKNYCKENQIYDCLPLCPPRCGLLSRIVCRKLHESIRKCKKGCTCKQGFKLDRTTEQCVKNCP